MKPGLYGTWAPGGGGCDGARLLGAVFGVDRGCVTMLWQQSGYKAYGFSGAGRQVGDRLLIETERSCRAVFKVSGPDLAFLPDESEPCMEDIGALAWLTDWRERRTSGSTPPPPNANPMYRPARWRRDFAGLRALCRAPAAGLGLRTSLPTAR